jgi:hypothetical protein
MGGPDPIFPLSGTTTENPLDALTRHWMNERNAPDILVFQGDILESLLDTLHQQVTLVLPIVLPALPLRLSFVSPAARPCRVHSAGSHG